MEDNILDRLKNAEEYIFYMYLLDMEDARIIEDIRYEEDNIVLAEPKSKNYFKQLVTKVKVEQRSLLKKVTYEPDFTFKLRHNVTFISPVVETDEQTLMIGDDKIYIDVKGKFAGRTNSTQYTFPIKQKWVYDKYGIYVNKIIPEKLIESSFYPSRLNDLRRTSSGKLTVRINGKNFYFNDFKNKKTLNEFCNE